MLAEIAACNAAWAILKGALTNGREIYEVADQATKYFDSKSAIAKKANKAGGKSELECFMQLEKLKAEEVWLKEYMIYAGRPDMYSDWLTFQSERKRAREKEILLAKQKKARNIALFLSALAWGTGLGILLPLSLYIAFKLFGVI